MTSADSTRRADYLAASDWGWATAGAFLWALVLIAIPPTAFDGLDFFRFCDPVLQLTRSSLLHGEIPWWNPYSALGRPFAADMQTAVFYPSTYLSLVFGIKAGWLLATTAHGMLALLGFTRLMHGIGTTRAAAWGGAFVFLFSAPLLGRMQAGQVPYVYALCYLPLVLWAAGRVATAPTGRSWAALALAWGLQLLCSHPQVSWLSALGAGAFVAGLLLQPPWGQALWRWWRAALAIATACACGLALLGFVVVPFVELIGQSDRAVPSLAFSSMAPMGLLHWFSLITGRSPLFPINWEYSVHFGAVALLGGLVGFIRWRDPAIRGAMCLIATGLSIAVGNVTPLFPLLFKMLPGLDNFRFPARAGVLVMFGLIVGATTLAGKIQPGRGSRIPIMITGLLLLAVTTFYYSQRMPENPESAHWFIGHIIVIIGAMLAWGLWLEQGPDDQRPLIWIRRFLLPTVLVGELCIALAGLKQPVESPPAQFTVESSVTTTIQAQSMDRQIAPVRVGLPPELIRENSGMIHHYATLTGFESLTLGRVSNYLHQAAGVDPDQVARITPVREIYDNASRFGAVSLSIARNHDSGLPLIMNPPDPRAYVVTRMTTVKDAPSAAALMVAGHPFHDDALIEQPFAEKLNLSHSTTGGHGTVTRFALNSLDVSVESPGNGLLVVAEAWYPGWRAEIDGRRVPCVPVNAWMRGVPVPAGHSMVRFTYHQNGLLPGCLVSLIAASILLWAARRPSASG